MNRLLKRQIRKHLSPELQENKELQVFLEAVNRSYNTSDDQFTMLQRATVISSDELYLANKQLKKESDTQKEIIKKLKNVIDRLKFYDLEIDENLEFSDFDSSKLVDFIDNQTKEIIEINKQKDILLKNLEKQNHELNDYAHMISHDLKSPLQIIDALVCWLNEDYESVLNEDGKEKIALIRENLEKMDTLIKGILQYSTIGKIEKKFYDVDLNFLLNQILEKTAIPENISIKVTGNFPVIKGDRYRLEQLFLIFLSNAIKFNNKEKGFVEIGCIEKSNHWQFYLKDNGKGIENEYFEKIFIPFQKLENDYQSSGIGLSVAKKIIEVYQGEIWIESIPNKSTTFHFSIKK